jgi:hypothetical protein
MGSPNASGTSLFGWCLPGVNLITHDECRELFTFYEKEITCPCLCHTDKDAFIKKNTVVTQPKTKRRKNASTTKLPT